MSKTQQLLTRLDEIGRSLEQTQRALALFGLGSVGADLHRLDEYSDLDFFAIVEAGAKPRFLADLDWLSSIRPIAYQFRNTTDGYKVLFDDDIFCEFAIFEPHELATIAFAPGRIVWKRPGVDERISRPQLAMPCPHGPDPAHSLGEALTNLYVGLGRYLRGEKLAAERLIQHHAVDRIVELSPVVETEQPASADPFAAERRYEQRFPHMARQIGAFVQGYDRTPESAEAILQFLETHFEVNAQMAQRIREMCALARKA